MSPDGSKIVPPEERLLRLIRGGRAGGSAAASSKSAGVAPSASAAAADRPAAPSPGRLWRLPPWWLVAVNATLGVVVLVELVAAGLVWVLPSDGAGEASAVDAAPRVRPLAGSTALETSTAPSLAVTATRPLFAAPTVATSSAGGGRASASAKAIAGRLSVIGIVEGDPSQAIIEDAETKKTYFTNAGQPVVDGWVVSDVRSDRVILESNGETVELPL